MKCLCCNKNTSNRKYCSRSCAAKINNKLKPKRLGTHKCKICQRLINCRNRYCDNCRKIYAPGCDKQLKDVIYKNNYKSAKFSLVRFRARNIGILLGKNRCEKCGYSKHVEICHKKPISDFSLDAWLSEINHIDNLIALCPNCHWELDHPN